MAVFLGPVAGPPFLLQLLFYSFIRAYLRTANLKEVKERAPSYPA